MVALAGSALNFAPFMRAKEDDDDFEHILDVYKRADYFLLAASSVFLRLAFPG